jgi:hypothetical protein
MTMKRPSVCEAEKCHNEAKTFCTECDDCFCINHSTYHELSCPAIAAKSEPSEPTPLPEPVVEPVDPLKEDEKKEGE